jgi:putative ABC transport system permease protein
VSNVLQDLRYAVRTLAKRPGFTAVVVVTLAIGIGACTAVFSIVNGILLRPLGYPEADRLVGIFSANATLQAAQPTEGWDRSNVSANDFVDWRARSRSFIDMGICTYTSYNLTGGDRPERVIAARASASLLPVLGFEARIGRIFGPDEDLPGHERVALLSDGFWRRRFAANPQIVGQTILLDGMPYEVLGVLPPEFSRAWGRFDQIWEPFDVWVPFAFAAGDYNRADRSYHAIGRLRPGVSVAGARAELEAIAASLAETYPDSNTGYTVNVMPLLDTIAGREVKQALTVLTAAVAFVLLIACVNVANLLLARGQTQAREYVIRAALGASRGRLIRQMLTECAVLSLAGGLLGALLAAWGVALLVTHLPDVVPRKNEIAVDRTALLVTLGLSCVAMLAAGLVPALRSGRVRLSDMFRDASPSRPIGRARWLPVDALIVGQIALAMGLTASAGLTARSFMRLLGADPGFDARQLLTMRTQLPPERYGDAERRVTFVERAVDEIRALPGVTAAAAISTLPCDGLDIWSYATIEEHVERHPRGEIFLGRITVTPEYFATMGIPLLEGRDFTELDDVAAQSVVIVNRTLAQRFWPGQSAVGKRLKYGARDAEGPWLTVVGVVGDVKQRGVTRETRLETYRPHAQVPASRMSFAVRTAGPPLGAARDVQEAIWDIDPELAVYRVRAMNDIVFDEFRPGGILAGLLTAFAVIALLLAGVGLYGTMAHAVGQRTHEIGIRVAVGARPGDVLRLVARRSMMLTVTGILAGVGLALLLGKGLRTLLYGVSPTDLLTLIGAGVTLLLVGLVASYIPARRATEVDPMVALRCE